MWAEWDGAERRWDERRTWWGRQGNERDPSQETHTPHRPQSPRPRQAMSEGPKSGGRRMGGARRGRPAQGPLIGHVERRPEATQVRSAHVRAHGHLRSAHIRAHRSPQVRSTHHRSYTQIQISRSVHMKLEVRLLPNTNQINSVKLISNLRTKLR